MLTHLHTVYGCPYTTRAELCHFGKDHVVSRAKNISYQAPYRKCLLTSGLVDKVKLHDITSKACILWPQPLSPGLALAIAPLNLILQQCLAAYCSLHWSREISVMKDKSCVSALSSAITTGHISLLSI